MKEVIISARCKKCKSKMEYKGLALMDRAFDAPMGQPIVMKIYNHVFFCKCPMIRPDAKTLEEMKPDNMVLIPKVSLEEITNKKIKVVFE